MKDFYKKVIVIFVACLVLFSIVPLFHIGDTTYQNSYVESVNYNGYYPLDTEDLFIAMGLEYVNGYYYSPSGSFNDIPTYQNYNYSVFGITGSDQNNCNSCGVGQFISLCVSYYTDTFIIFTYIEDDGSYLTSFYVQDNADFYDVVFIGISNYEGVE